MRKQMNFKKNMIVKVIVFAVVCGMATGIVYVPIFAQEREESLHNVLEQEEKEEKKVIEKQEETVSGNDTEDESPKEGDGTATGEETGNESGSAGDETDFGDDGEEETSKHTEKESVSSNDIETEATDMMENEDGQEEPEIINVVVPTAYTLALNPYRLPIRTGEDEITTKQIVSGTYGIVNKSSSDQIVTVSLTVEDGNEGELVFVDSVEDAENAGMNVYAICLTAVPANEDQIFIDGSPLDKNVTGKFLQNVRMSEAQEQAVVLHEGENEIAFKLSKAVYDRESAHQEEAVLKELAPDGMGVTAYTLNGVMNPDASWEKLSEGIKLSVVYSYRTADGDEEIVEGTGAMVGAR